MKRIAPLFLLLALVASPVHAVGVDLNVVACPGNAGASNNAGTLDCAGGSTLVLLGTFQPAEAVADLVAADAILDMTIVGDLGSTGNFWDFENANRDALNGAPGRPTAGCPNYVNAFGVANSGFAAAAAVQAPSRLRIATTSYRINNLAVVANERIFAFQLLFDLSTSVEAGQGGTTTGCTAPMGIAFAGLIPGSASNTPVTTLTSGSSSLSSVVANGATQPLPLVAQTWGQVKSMYR